MFKTVRSLESTNAQPFSQADVKLQETQLYHTEKHKTFHEQVVEQQQIDKNNVRLLTEGIDQLERLLVTERDLQKSELDPMLEEMNVIIDETRQGYARQIESLEKTLQKYQDSVRDEMDEFEVCLQQQTEKRKATFSAMQQEFLRSMDDITSQFRIEEKEREKQADSIDQAVHETLAEHSTLVDKQQQMLTDQLKEAQEQHAFDAKIIQNIGIKKFVSVRAQIEEIQKSNQKEKEERTQLEEKIANEIETIAQKLKAGLDVFGQQLQE